jgi:hypothetical protein
LRDKTLLWQDKFPQKAKSIDLGSVVRVAVTMAWKASYGAKKCQSEKNVNISLYYVSC